MATLDKAKAFRAPIVSAEVVVQETASTSFADLVRLMAEGIADAQMALDRSAAEMVTELAETTVQIIPSITEEVAADGTVSFTQGAPQTVSLSWSSFFGHPDRGCGEFSVLPGVIARTGSVTGIPVWNAV